MKVSEICQYTGGSAIQPYDDFEVAGVSTDSRTIKPGEVFIALDGESFDGHSFCQSAVNNGAKVLVVTRLPQLLPGDDVVIIMVKNTLKAYQDIAACYRSKFDLPVIAVTGSTGKTSTKDIIAAALATGKNVLKSQGNYNNEIGLPLTLLQLTHKHELVIVEMAMRGPGQIRELAQIARPDIAVVTNVGQTHIELLGSQENIAAAKQELVEELPVGGTAILNFDNEYVRAMADATKAKKIFYGFDPKADIRAENIRREKLCTVFHCVNKITDEEYDVSLPLLGEHNVYNTLAAIAVCTALKIDREKMLSGISTVVLSGMRQEISETCGMLFVNDAYNASPTSMQAAIRTLHSMPGKRKVAVLGDMLELGEIAEAAHRQVGMEIVKQRIDLVVTVGNKSHFISSTASEYGVRSWHFQNHASAAQALSTLLNIGDTVLFKGSRGMHMEELLAVLKEKLAGKNND